MAKVLQPGPLPELAMGDPSGVPVIEYGSLTCPHCAVFSKETFPQLKADYIDTGKVRFIFREFSRNTAGRRRLRAGALPRRRQGLRGGRTAVRPAGQMGLRRQAARAPHRGVARDRADPGEGTECLKNQKLADGIVAIAKRANDEIHLTGTPTFVIDGKVYGGELTLDQLKAILDPLVKK